MSKVIGAETTAKIETQLNGNLIAYWSVTLLLAGSITLSGIGQLMQLGGNIELVTNIGYPLYITNILGTWKILGVIAIVVPRFPRLKEWAHAGLFFLMTGAFGNCKGTVISDAVDDSPNNDEKDVTTYL